MEQVVCELTGTDGCRNEDCSCSVPHDIGLRCKCRCWETGEFKSCQPIGKLRKKGIKIYTER